MKMQWAVGNSRNRVMHAVKKHTTYGSTQANSKTETYCNQTLYDAHIYTDSASDLPWDVCRTCQHMLDKQPSS